MTALKFILSFISPIEIIKKFTFYFGSSSTPADTTNTTTMELPEWARGYAKDTLAKTSALTDINTNPYQQYGGERIAGFNPMQQQAFQGAANMQPSQQVGMGSDIAGMAGLGALGTNYQGGNFQGGQFDSQAAQQYMSPYNQNVVDYQKAQAVRDYQIAQPMRQAQAVQQGAFGGSRSAIMDAEAQRSLNSQLQGIEATGQQNAYANAQQQFNTDQSRRLQAQQLGEQSRQYGAGLGMQGLQTGLQAASTLGQLGQTQYGQQMGINQLQSAYGTQQQQQAQRPLDMAYQDFMNQQNYPYKQLGFMSDMIRGLPLGQQSTAQVYQAPPSAIQTVGALGLGAYGVNQLTKAKGGLAGAYAGGGMVAFGDGGDTDVTDSPMDDPSVMAKEVSKLSDQQLQEIVQHPSSAAELQAAKMELATRASEKNGLASAYNMMPQQAPTTQATPQAPQMAQQAPQQPMMQAARGGIMGFAGNDGSDVDLQKLINQNNEDAGYVNQDDLDENEGGDATGQVSTTGMSEVNAVNKIGSKAMTPDEYLVALAKTNKSLRDQAGTDSGYEQFSQELADAKRENAGAFEQQKGLAALAAIPAVLQGGNAVRGIGAGTGAFANLYGQYASADKKQKLALSEMQFKLADAKRKENLGLTKDAVAAMDAVRKSGAEADKFELEKINTKNKLLKTVAIANKPVKGPSPNYDINAQAAHVRNLKNTEKPLKGETPEQYNDRIEAMAFDIHTAAKNAKDITSRANVTSNVTSVSDIKGTKGDVEQQNAATREKAADEASLAAARLELNKLKKSRDPRNQKKWQGMVDKHGSEQAASEKFIEGYMVKKPTDAAPAPAAPVAKPAAAPTGKVMTQADVAATAKARGVTEAEVIDRAKKAGYTIK